MFCGTISAFDTRAKENVLKISNVQGDEIVSLKLEGGADSSYYEDLYLFTLKIHILYLYYEY